MHVTNIQDDGAHKIESSSFGQAGPVSEISKSLVARGKHNGQPSQSKVENELSVINNGLFQKKSTPPPTDGVVF